MDVFFYGLFMDGDVLRDSHVSPADPRRGYADDFALRIGRRATLTPSAGGRVYGMVYALTQVELDRLYAAPGLEQYRPETISIRTFGGESLRALCYNLATVPQPGEANAEYAARLRDVLAKLGFPHEYIDAVA